MSCLGPPRSPEALSANTLPQKLFKPFVLVNEETNELEQGLQQGFQSLDNGRPIGRDFISFAGRPESETSVSSFVNPQKCRAACRCAMEEQVLGQLVCPPIKAASAEQTAILQS